MMGKDWRADPCDGLGRMRLAILRVTGTLYSEHKDSESERAR